MLYQIMKYQSNMQIEYTVISLGLSHYFESEILKMGIPVIDVKFNKNPFGALWRIYKAVQGADVLCCWMYYANILGYFVGKCAKVGKIIWFIRHSNLEKSKNKKRILFINRLCARISSKVDKVVYNGFESRLNHEKSGYDINNGYVIENGCDCMEYSPLSTANFDLLRELRITPEKKILLSVTRNHPIKDIPTLVKAFGIVHRVMPNVVCVIVGVNYNECNKEVVDNINRFNLKVGYDIIFLGIRHDIPRLMAGCNLFVLHSLGEAFPNVLIQAMACGCICVSTDVGDAHRILNDTDFIANPGDSNGLSRRIRFALSLPDVVVQKVKENNRARVVENFEIHKIVQHYEELYL